MWSILEKAEESPYKAVVCVVEKAYLAVYSFRYGFFAIDDVDSIAWIKR